MESNNKYKELFEFSKVLYDQEFDRFIRLNEKASYFMYVAIILIGILGNLPRWLFNKYLPPSNLFALLIIILFYLAFISFVVGSLFAFNVLKNHKTMRFKLDDRMIDFFKDNQIRDIHYALSKELQRGFNNNRKLNIKKATSLFGSYICIIIAIACTVIMFVLVGIDYF